MYSIIDELFKFWLLFIVFLYFAVKGVVYLISIGWTGF
jgi:hypothetical protein